MELTPESLISGYKSAWREKRFQDASEFASKLIDFDRTEPLFHHLKGNALSMLKKYNEALDSQRRSVEIDPRSKYLNSLSVALDRVGEKHLSFSTILMASVMGPYKNQNPGHMVKLCAARDAVELGFAVIMKHWRENNSKEELLKLCNILYKNRIEENPTIKTPIDDLSDATPSEIIRYFESYVSSINSSDLYLSVTKQIENRNPQFENKSKKFTEIISQGMKESKTLVYSTERKHPESGRRLTVGGMADRIKGAATVMIIAASLEYKFQLDWKSPIDIEKFFNMPESFKPNKTGNASGINWIDTAFPAAVKEKLSTSDVEELFPEKHNLMHVNSMNLEILRNPNYSALDEFRNMGRVFWVGTLFRLLSYKPGLDEIIALSSFSELKKFFDKSIGIQYRLGGDRGGWKDPVLDDIENLTKVIDIVRKKHIDEKILIFFASDSPEAKEITKKHSTIESPILTMNIPITHVDRSETRDAEEGFSAVLMENYCLSLCDLIYVRKGAFGEMAANRCFQEPQRIEI